MVIETKSLITENSYVWTYTENLMNALKYEQLIDL